MSEFFIDDYNDTVDYQVTGPVVPDAMDCMRCGVCLSQCPTFQLTKDEQEGPRQRIRTLEQLLIHQETVSDEALIHLNNCTQCRACESICPSKMDYALLFNQAQQQLSQQPSRNILATLALRCIEDRKLKITLLPLVWLYQCKPINALVTRSGLLKRLGINSLTSFTRRPALKALTDQQDRQTSIKGKVALFTGCISEDFDRQTLDDTAKVLRTMGYGVVIPQAQVCCGAIHAHQGELDTAKTLMNQNRACFNALDVDAIIYCATGCGAELQAYGEWLALDKEPAFKPPLFEVMDFIAQHWDDVCIVSPAFERVVVHEPCSHRNVLKTVQSVYTVLNKIPGLVISTLDNNQLCCGAGGVYMLTHPQQARALREQALIGADMPGGAYLVSTNIGCALHLEADSNNGQGMPVKHPVSVLAAQIATIPQSQPV